MSMSRTQQRVMWGLVAGGAIVALIVVLIFAVFIPQSVTSEGNQMEAKLGATYANGANYLSACVVKTEQSVGLVNANTDALDKILKDAIAGRYDTESQAGSAKLFSAIVEAYPNLSGLDATFQNVLATINGCRDDYKNMQSVVLDNVREFNAWRTGSWRVRTFGGSDFPNDNLIINLPGLHLTGSAALAKMSAPIVDAGTSGAYDTGLLTGGDPFATPTK